jgi:pimeloyl-ACP methyl ester carboxylesterase
VTYVIERLAQLRRHLDHLRRLQPRVPDATALRSDLSLHNDVLFSLLTVTQLVIDIAGELAGRKGLRFEDYTEAVRALEAYDEFSPALVDRLTTPHDGPRWYKDILIDPDSVLHPISNDSTGGADAFLTFLAEELASEIDRRYRTAPFRVLLGHSLGGLFVTRALLTRPESFHAYLASSPSLAWNDREIVRDARRALAALPDASRFFYMAAGDREPGGLTPASELASVLEMHAPPGLRWWYRVNPGETHQSNPVPTYAQGLSTLFAIWPSRRVSCSPVTSPRSRRATRARRRRTATGSSRPLASSPSWGPPAPARSHGPGDPDPGAHGGAVPAFGRRPRRPWPGAGGRGSSASRAGNRK